MAAFWGELRRRNVFKVAVAYAIVGWLLVQIISIVLPTFDAPRWIVQTVTFLILIGFPVVLVLAWAFESQHPAIGGMPDAEGRQSRARGTGHALNFVILGLVALAVGFLLIDRFILEAGVPATSSVVSSYGPAAANAAMAPTLTAAQPALPVASRPVRRYATNLGTTAPLGNTHLSAHVAISRDGRRLAYAVREGGPARIYVRDLEQLEARAIPGTEGAYHPFFSPDGEWIGYYSDETDQKLKRVSVRGGSPRALADAGFAAGGSWASEDVIIFATTDPFGGRGLFRMPASGGTPELLLQSNAEVGYITPEVLPGGEAVLFVVRPGSGGNSNARDGSIAVLSLATGEHRTLIEGAYRPQYAPTGHIVFVRGGDLWAVPFDVESLQITGLEAPVVEGVQQTGFTGAAAYAFSHDGVLLYVPGSDVSGDGARRRLVWVDRQGREEPLPAEPLAYFQPRLSPDGQRLAVTIGLDSDLDIWIYDLARATSSRLTFEPGIDDRPLWTPDGQRVVYRSSEGDGLFWRAADGTGQAERLTESAAVQLPHSFSPEGMQLVFHEMHPGGRSDLYVLSLTNQAGGARPLLQGEFNETSARLSPDGEWLAYTSDETGREEIYVRPFPNVDEGKWQISRDGGAEPRWGAAGRELFYRQGGAVMSVAVETEARFSAGTPSLLFDGTYVSAGNARPSYDVTADGQRFLMLRLDVMGPAPAPAVTQLVVVDNWFEELERLTQAVQ